jgi:hypothetical protein
MRGPGPKLDILKKEENNYQFNRAQTIVVSSSPSELALVFQ